MDKILSLELPGETHVCRRYVRKDGQMVFGYCLIFDAGKARPLKGVLQKVYEVLAQAKPSLAAAAPAPTPQPPPTQTRNSRPLEIRVVERRVDEDGNEIIIEEMQLPHVRAGDMNKPTHKGGRGAARTATSTR
jgi:hypothetical protein